MGPALTTNPVAFCCALRHAGVRAAVNTSARLFRTLDSDNGIDDQIKLYQASLFRMLKA